MWYKILCPLSSVPLPKIHNTSWYQALIFMRKFNSLDVQFYKYRNTLSSEQYLWHLGPLSLIAPPLFAWNASSYSEGLEQHMNVWRMLPLVWHIGAGCRWTQNGHTGKSGQSLDKLLDGIMIKLMNFRAIFSGPFWYGAQNGTLLIDQKWIRRLVCMEHC